MSNIILHPNGHMIFKTPSWSIIQSTIPTAHFFPTPDGEAVVAVPHRLDEWTVLRNLGVVGPSLLTNWKYTGMYTPRSYQEWTTSLFVHNKVAFCFNETGTGKTSPAVWAAEYLLQHDKIDCVLVLSTLSSLESTWASEIFKTAPHRRYSVVYGSTAKDKREALAEDVHFYIINHDGFKLPYILDKLLKDKRRWLVILDEGSKFKGRKSDRHKAFVQFVRKHNPYRWLLTATPMPQGPDDAYGLAQLMYPDRVPMSYLQFRENTQIQVNSHKWIKKNGWREVAFSLLQPGILIRKRDHIKELPPLTFEDYYAPLSAPAKKAYEAIFDDFVYAEVKEGQLSRQVTAINAAAKVTKLLQISSGTVYDDEREVMYVDVASKKSLLTDIAEKTPGKIIVYVPFRPALQVVAEHMRAQGYKTEVVFGDVSKAQRDVIFKAMQDGDLDCIVGQPDSMSHSITLTAASDIVWWGPTPNAETYEQANGRIERLGQTNPMTIHRLYSSNAERRVYELLADKTFSQQSLLELYLDEAQRR